MDLIGGIKHPREGAGQSEMEEGSSQSIQVQMRGRDTTREKSAEGSFEKYEKMLQ